MAIVDIGIKLFKSLDLSTLLVFVLVACITYLIWIRRDKRVPPGPTALPIVGNLFSLASADPFESFARLREKYGDIYSVYIGRELTVVLNGYDTIYDALVRRGSTFSRRPMNPFSVAVLEETGIVGSNDKSHKDHRALCLNGLNHLCFKNDSHQIEDRILFEIKKFLDRMVDCDGAVDPAPDLSISLANIMSNLIIGKSFDFENERFNDFLRKHHRVLAALPARIALVNCFPFLLKLPLDIFNLKSIVEGVHTWQTFLKERLLGGASDDFIAIYLDALKKNDEKELDQTFSKRMLRNVSFDLMIAGSQTVASTIAWLLLYILHDKELETRLHTEIDEIIGPDRTPSLTDRPSMPYMEAVILEGLRIACAAPLAVPHSVPHDVMYKGHLIPEETTIIVNLNSVLMDPVAWEDPKTFRPERFLSEDKTTLQVPKYHIPFSVGQRSCLGETFARMSLFLYLTAILQRFRLAPKDNDSLPPIKGNIGLTYHPDPYELRLIKR